MKDHSHYSPKIRIIRDYSKGFTLIELLIVVAIIGLLASTILVGLGNFRQAGRDARRIVDLRQIQAGLEIYFQQCGHYPGGPNCSIVYSPHGYYDMVDAILDTDLDINQIPNDPLHATDDSPDQYYYAVLAEGPKQGKKYILGARLEDARNAQLRSDIDSDDVDNPAQYRGDLPDGSCDDRLENPIYCIEL